MSEKLHQIIYISTAEPVLTEDTLLELLLESQERNTEHKITGLVLHADGNIIQIIEGPEAATKRLFKNIKADHRHRGVTLISSKCIERRDFPQYKMGFKRTYDKDLQTELTNFSHIVDKGALSPEELEGMSKIVRVFLETFVRTTNIGLSIHNKVKEELRQLNRSS